jgi:glycosyltransferase involved in cell wall biosynthesis
MKILMMTNTYTPFVGGVARSVRTFAAECRKMGHRVLVVAPVFEGMPASEKDVIRVPAVQHFNGSDFSVVLPIPGFLSSKLETFEPDIVHSHYPFMLGSTAVRAAGRFDCPLVFTYHTMYEHYVHYVPAEADRMREFVINLAMGYCNLCDRVLAPSQSVAQMLRERGVKTAVDVLPTGVYVGQYERGDRAAFRRKYGIPQDALVAGYVGRLAPEKNLSFLGESVAAFATQNKRGHFLVVGSGPSEKEICAFFAEKGMEDRLHLTGTLHDKALIDAYHAMDIFVFASKTETQGLVLMEAMAANVPVVALDAPAVREVVNDGVNGYLVRMERSPKFAEAIGKVAGLPSEELTDLRREAKKTAESFSMQSCAQKLIRAYQDVLQRKRAGPRDETPWAQAAEQVKAEWELVANLADAARHTLRRPD